jgi:hypothetical protein
MISLHFIKKHFFCQENTKFRKHDIWFTGELSCPLGCLINYSIFRDYFILFGCPMSRDFRCASAGLSGLGAAT